MRGEVDLGKPRWLPKHSAVNVQGLARFDHRKLSRRMGELSTTQMASVQPALRDLLGL
jgi:mRNA-degrading endonuclease toxin of MazEF toxin-antitoxin module